MDVAFQKMLNLRYSIHFFTTKPVGEGFGLGLAIAKSIIEDHKGKLYFKSVVHHGTTFYIELPIQQSFVSQS